MGRVAVTSGRSVRRQVVALAMLVAFAASVTMPQASFADPPPWAPAHGWRAKHKHKGEQVHYPVPFDIDLGRCNRELLGAVLGGVAGGVIGAQVGKGDERTVAIVGGAIIGVLIGGAIGRRMDQVDHACVGQILEYGEDGRIIYWRHPESDVIYRVVPQRTFTNDRGAYCRDYSIAAVNGGGSERFSGTACRAADGSWRKTG
jgi:surface antigen